MPPDTEVWAGRKRAAVLRFGTSTMALNQKFGGDEEGFRKTFCMSEEQAGRYAIHGGGVPVFVEGVEGVVAVVVVSGLTQEEDHGVIGDAVGAGWALAE